MTDLDFSGLMNIGADTSAPASAPPADTDVQRLTYELDSMKKKNDAVSDGYRRLQENKRLTNDAKTKLIKDIQAGDADLKALLVDALEIIGTATHDTAFTNASKRHLSDQL